MMKIRYTGSTQEQRRWGSYTGNYAALVIGKEYELDHQEVHAWHTKYFLKGVEGSFNSACFEAVDVEPPLA